MANNLFLCLFVCFLRKKKKLFSWLTVAKRELLARRQSHTPDFCHPVYSVSEIRDGEALWLCSSLEIRLKAFRRSTIPQDQFIINSLPFVQFDPKVPKNVVTALRSRTQSSFFVDILQKMCRSPHIFICAIFQTQNESTSVMKLYRKTFTLRLSISH